jgi:pimeloyl-ACP methyl ester carboxylesterase
LPSLWNDLPSYSGKAIFFAGEADAKYSLLARRMAQCLSSAQTQILSGCGHRLLDEAAPELAHAVADFLATNFRIGPSTPYR